MFLELIKFSKSLLILLILLSQNIKDSKVLFSCNVSNESFKILTLLWLKSKILRVLLTGKTSFKGVIS